MRHAVPGQILEWLAQVPATILENHPLLAIKHLWVLLETGHLDEVLEAGELDEVEPRLETLEKMAASDPELRQETLIIRIHLARHQQAYDLAISLGQQLPNSTPLTPKSLSIKLGVVFGLAEAYRLRGELMAAQAQFSEAVRLSEMIGSVTYVLRARLGLAQIHIARNEWNPAVSALQDILATADPDFPLETSLAQELLDKAPSDNFSSATPLVASLTSREIDVLGWLDSDLSVAEIGEQLFVSTNTIKTHLKNIYAKLGARSRYEAVVVAKEAGCSNLPLKNHPSLSPVG